MPTIFTVGHGTKAIDELIDVLRSAGIEVLVDVRRFPGSRRHPHFSREALERALPESDIRYEWRGETLGGRRGRAATSRHHSLRNAAFQGYADFMDTDEFRAAVKELEDEAATKRIAI